MNLPMSWDEWADHDGVALAARVAKGELTAAELAAQAAAGIAKVDPALSGVVEIFEDAVADPATDGTNLDGPFAGLPFLMKDLGPTMQGRLQEMGSLLMRGNRAGADTFLTGKLRQAGLNLIGRTTTPEFGVCSSADNPAVYVTRNPWNTDYTTCGSSAGSAAMVAAGTVPIAHATDGGGSIRIPAGVNGNIGLKVSRGVFSLSPHLSHLWGEYQATPHIAAELQKVGRFLESLGHHVDYALPALDFRDAFAAQTTCYISNFAVVISNMLAARGLEQPPADLIEPINIRIWEHGRHTSYADRARMQAVFNTTSRGFGAFFEDWDVILTPITALPTPKVGTTEYLTISDNPDVLDWFGNLWRNFAFTPLANLCGIPAISLPLATHEHGLPLGIQAIAKQANDGLLLQLAAQIERAIGGKWNAGQKPGVHVT